MTQRRIIGILIILVLASFAMQATLARFTDEFDGAGTALVAKWNFGARGQEDIEGEFYNKGFTFDLFNAQSVQPMDFGMKSFTFTGGASDVSIAYDVKMNVQDLLLLTAGTIAGTTDVDVYAPFIFKITAEINDGATNDPPVVFTPPGSNDGWFRPGDITADADGFFSIFDTASGEPTFSKGSPDQVTVTVYWQWNTSCFINDTATASVNPPIVPNISTVIADTYLPYYQVAYDEYYGPGGLDEQRKAAASAVEAYLVEHGSPTSDGVWIHNIDCHLTDSQHYQAYSALPPEEQTIYLWRHGGSLDPETGEITWFPHSYLCPADHFAEYNQLVETEHECVEACETSLMAAYDEYDTLAAEALIVKESVKVIFQIQGDQMQPN